MKKRKIDFQKLIDGEYQLNTALEVINWMLKTGQGNEDRRGWNLYGVDQHLFCYSANNNRSGSPFPLDSNLNMFVECLLFRGVVKHAYNSTQIIEEWREKNNIRLGASRMLSFPEEYPAGLIGSWRSWNLHWHIIELNEYIGRLLKKELFQPTYKDRINPKIIGISFYTCGYGYTVKYNYSFENFNYEPGWNEYISQKAGESIDMFIFRAHKELNELLK